MEEKDKENQIVKLKQMLIDKISGFAVTSQLKENPSFELVLGEIIQLLDVEKIHSQFPIAIEEKNGVATLKWQTESGDKYSCSMFEKDSKQFSSVITKEYQVNGTDHKAAYETAVFINENNDMGVVEYVAGAHAGNTPGETNNYTSVKKSSYTPEGIMDFKEEIYYPVSKLTRNFDTVGINDMLFAPKTEMMGENYDVRLLMRRQQFDTAHVVYTNKKYGQNFIGEYPLMLESGLAAMRVATHFLNGENVFIPPLSEAEIEMKLRNEPNEEVRKNLKELAEKQKRTGYSYNSVNDSGYTATGFEQSSNQSI